MVASALIAAGAQLLGGILGRNSEKAAIKRQNEYNSPAQIRARAEAAGFNPLLFVGPGVGQQVATGGSNYMGQAIAEAGLMAADKLSERQASTKLDQARAENKRLNQQLTKATIRPKVDGIYARAEMAPTRTEALGGKDGAAISASDRVRMAHSPLASSVGDNSDNRTTGVQQSVKQDVAAFRFLGHDFYGSGLFSTAQQFEDGLGDSEILSTVMAPVLIADAVGNEAVKGLRHAYSLYSQDRSYSNAVKKRRAALPKRRVVLDPPSGLWSPNGGHW